ncbi:GNAT family N-acetyltransferase [Aurantimonas sp. C2-6-R+9]|uniref:GNAT family N-acetyltransferase n=2 Tax=unclassified Aurantimonas TaxID=2638230 RepID=UPI002E170201|nr:GNAT family N-acetyltransferase [Aurantimonas sp. C2-3-R2]MEC5381080.1 GNAT family N-acetyltransferase [Aurantimonas sp. C2-6-R+9]
MDRHLPFSRLRKDDAMTEDFTAERDGATIESGRLRLRPLAMKDAQPLANLANDRHLAAMLARIPHPYRLSDARAFIADHGSEIVFALCLKEEDRFVGCCGLKPSGRKGRAELGYWVGWAYWGRGIATEGAQAVIDYGFTRLQLDAIDVSCRVVNESSRRVIRKCGFHFCGSGMIESVSSGRVASEHFVMDRSCWTSLKAWGRQ